MCKVSLLLVISVLLRTCSSGASAAQQTEPVNVINESGHDIGPCPAGASMSYPPTPYKGTAFFLLRAQPTLAARHASLAGQSPANAVWLRRLDGPSAANRLLTTSGGERVFVLWSCKPHDCGSNFVYGAYNLITTEYQLQIGGSPQTEVLGTTAPVLSAAIACARTLDDAARQRAEQPLKKLPGS